MKKLHKMILTALLISPLFMGSIVFAQTPGTLTCTYTTTFTGGGWGTKNCLAAWIQTNSGTFIKTKFKYCSSGNLDHLATFTSKPSYNNYTDATTGITLDWVPTYVGMEENQNQLSFSISPNPANDKSTISYSLNKTEDVTISMYDISGKLVKVIFDQNQDAGNYNLPFYTNVKPGVYFVKMYTGNAQHTERILITE